LFFCSVFAADPTVPTGFPPKFYSWMVVSVTRPGVPQPLYSKGQMIAFDLSNKYACRFKQQNLLNLTAVRPSDYCDANTKYHYEVADTSGGQGLNPPCEKSVPLTAGSFVPIQYPQQFIQTAIFMGKVPVNQKMCNHFYAPSVTVAGSLFQIDVFSDDNGYPCQIGLTSVKTTDVVTYAFDGFAEVIPGGIPCDVAKLLCPERTWTCQVNPSATPQALQAALSWVCGVEDCSPINPGGSHYFPNTLKDHCNWAFDTYYINQRLSQGSYACDFAGAAVLAPPNLTMTHPINIVAPPPKDFPTFLGMDLICNE